MMTLTPRRMETLTALRELCLAAGRPVHYSQVAARMGISAWTAYGLLRELEAEGAAVRSHQPAGGRGRGRSQILFQPASPSPAADARNAVRAAFERFVAIGDDVAAATAYLADPGDMAAQLGFWLARLPAAGKQAADAARGVLEGGSEPLVKIQVVVAMSLGSTLARVRQDHLARRIARASTRFTLLLQEAARVPDGHMSALVDAARALERRAEVVAQ